MPDKPHTLAVLKGPAWRDEVAKTLRVIADELEAGTRDRWVP